MIFDIILAILVVALAGVMAYTVTRENELIGRLSKLALTVAKLEETMKAVDESTGRDVYLLRKEFETFKDDYGDAAVEEMRQHAKREKAWADGIDSIMSYGARYQGRGDST